MDEAKNATTLKQARLFMEAFMAFYKVHAAPKSREGAKQMELKLIKIQKLEGRLELRSGLRIWRLRGRDSEVVGGGQSGDSALRTQIACSAIPGSSPKGAKCAACANGSAGAVEPEPLSFKHIDNAALVKPILQLFGMGGGDKLDDKQAGELGPTRLAVWDAPLNENWRKEIEDDNNLLVEVKTENRIDRIRGVAEHPRQTERVPAGAKFDFTVSIKVLNIDSADGKDLRTVLYRGLRLASELDSSRRFRLTRGYGKVKFSTLKLDETDVQAEFEAVDPFAA